MTGPTTRNNERANLHCHEQRTPSRTTLRSGQTRSWSEKLPRRHDHHGNWAGVDSEQPRRPLLPKTVGDPMGRGKHAPEMGSSWSASARSPCTSARMAHATPVRRWQSYGDGATFRRGTRWGDHSFSWGDGLRKSMRCALQYLGNAQAQSRRAMALCGPGAARQPGGGDCDGCTYV